jgi:CBS domain-containing protein
MEAHSITCLVIRDEGGRPSGIIRLQDILRARIL